MKKQHDKCRTWLESYREMRYEIIRLQRKHQGLWDQATGITAKLSPVPGGGGGDRDRLLSMLADADEDVIGKYIEAVTRQQEIEAFIEDIPSAVSRIILRLRYVELLRWPEIEEALTKSKIFYESRQIFRLHGAALREARELWNKRKENT